MEDCVEGDVLWRLLRQCCCAGIVRRLGMGVVYVICSD